MKQAMSVLTSSKSNDWYTPPRYIEAARKVMGGIDLDPASCEIANEWIQAEVWIGDRANGLTFPWEGRVWINPPYGKTGNKSNQELWARKLLREYLAGNVTEAILLTKTVPGYYWWDWMFNYWPGPVCITWGRIAFIKLEWVRFINGQVVVVPPAGDHRSKAASSFWYLGPHTERFKATFSEFGRCLDSAEKRVHERGICKAGQKVRMSDEQAAMECPSRSSQENKKVSM